MLKLLSLPYRQKIVIVLAALFVISCSGCSHHEAVTIPSPLMIDDRASLISSKVLMSLRKRTQSLNNETGARFAILTLPSPTSTEPSGFVDHAFDAAPYFGTLLGDVNPKTPSDVAAIREDWSKRGVLIVVSEKPQLVAIRVGSDLRTIIDDTELQHIMELEVYPLIMKNRVHAATEAAFRVIEERLHARRSAVKDIGTFRTDVGITFKNIKMYSFPLWPVYYKVLLDPLLNSLILTMKMTGWSTWGVVLWLLLLHILTKKNWVHKIFFAINRTIVLKHFTSLTRKNKDSVDAARVMNGVMNASYVAGYETTAFKLTLGLPVWASLSLITLPLWENILTLRHHLRPELQQGLSSHTVFALQHGILWWDKPTATAGFGFAVVFGIVYALQKIPDLVLTFWIGSMTEFEAKNKGVPETMYLN